MIDGIVDSLTIINEFKDLHLPSGTQSTTTCHRCYNMPQVNTHTNDITHTCHRCHNHILKINDLQSQLDVVNKEKAGLSGTVNKLADAYNKMSLSKGQTRQNQYVVNKNRVMANKKREIKVKVDIAKEQKFSNGDLKIESLFFPSNENKMKIIKHLESANTSICICVYFITDTQISSALKALARKGIKINIITNILSATQAIDQLENTKNIEMIVYDCQADQDAVDDNSEKLMHHKFAIVDEDLLIIGSFNYTEKASTINYESVIVLNHRPTINAFMTHFEELWSELDEAMVEESESEEMQYYDNRRYKNQYRYC